MQVILSCSTLHRPEEKNIRINYQLSTWWNNTQKSDIATSITSASYSMTFDRPTSEQLNSLKIMSLTYLIRRWSTSSSQNLSTKLTFRSQSSRFFIAKIPLSLLKLKQDIQNKTQKYYYKKHTKWYDLQKSRKTIFNLLLRLLRYISKDNIISREPKINFNNFTPDCGQVWYLKPGRGNN